MNNTLESFAPVRQRFRRLSLLAKVWFWIFLLSTCIGTALSLDTRLLGIFAAITWFAMFAAAIAASIQFKCTGCGSSLHRTNGAHCPGCGARALVDGDWLTPRECSSCGLKLRYRKSRQFKIHYCSHCGAYLDEQGL